MFMTNPFFRLILFVCVPVMFCDGAASQNTEMKLLETEHYRIFHEPASSDKRPVPEEIGAILERFHAGMERGFGRIFTEAVAKKNREEAKNNKPAAEKPVEEPKEIPPGERTDFYFFDLAETLKTKLAEEGIPNVTLHLHGGYYNPGTRSFYVARRPGLYETRSAILLEAVYAYLAESFPGTRENYPEWFRDTIAMTLVDHLWNGRKLSIGIMAPFREEQFDELALDILREFRDLIQHEALSHSAETPDMKTEESSAASKNAVPSRRQKTQAPAGTAVTPEILSEFFGAASANPDFLAKKQTFYWVFGKYLFAKRMDVIRNVLAEMAVSEDLLTGSSENAAPTADVFLAAWKKATEKQPVTVEQLGFWLKDNPAPWECVFKEWQFTGEDFICRTSDAAILVFNVAPNTIPPFKVRVTQGNAVTGLVVNYEDKDNYDSIRLHDSGDVSYTRKINGNWGEPEIVFPVAMKGNRKSPLYHAENMVFSVQRRKEMTEVSINNILVYTGRTAPNLRFGMLLEGFRSEAVFFPKP
jgi:hypothetical protein